MSHHHAHLSAQKRTITTKGALRQLRKKGYVPAIIYGGSSDAIPVFLSYKDVTMLHEKGQLLSHMFKLDLEGAQEKVVSCHVYTEPLKGNIIHIDFLRVSEDSRLEVDVPITFINQASCSALASEGGALHVASHTLKLLCLAEEIPEHIIVDLSHFSMGSVIHIHDITLPEGTKNLASDKTIATITLPRVEQNEAKVEASEKVESKPSSPSSEESTNKKS